MNKYGKQLEEIADWFNSNIGECTHDSCVMWYEPKNENEKEYWRKIMALRHIAFELNKDDLNDAK